MKYAYYPGCSLHGTNVDYDESTKAVADALGIELEEIPNWSCCGSTPAHCTDPYLAAALPARNLLAAKEISNDVVMCCAACFSRFKFAQKHIEEEPELRRRLSETIPLEDIAEMRTRHFLDVLLNDVGLDKISQAKEKDLSGLKVACYYGCLLTRPPKVTEFDDPEDPTSMDKLLRAVGAETLDWPFKTECCGATFSLTRTEIVLRLSHDILEMAKESGADCIALACPLCQTNLDMRQSAIESKYGVRYRIPIFYFTQLLGLAFGKRRKELGLRRANVSSKKLLKERKIA